MLVVNEDLRSSESRATAFSGDLIAYMHTTFIHDMGSAIQIDNGCAKCVYTVPTVLVNCRVIVRRQPRSVQMRLFSCDVASNGCQQGTGY